MASIARRFAFYSSNCPRRIPQRPAITWQRPFSTTIPSLARRRGGGGDTVDPRETNRVMEDLERLGSANALDPSITQDAPQSQTAMNLPDWDAVEDEWNEEDLDVEEEERVHPSKIGFWGEGEEELGADEDYYGDDLTALGHGELEQHRELREYARLAAWELPLLSKLAKPFEPPSKATPLRFRYTSYMGEQHDAVHKVVVEFCVSDMPDLTQVQKEKLIKLAGPRYNPDKDIIKMSCELFQTISQNKQYLGQTIDGLLKEARDGKDTFADVPFDFRHHKPKVRHQFPKEWLLTPERKQYLESKRQQQLQLDSGKENKGLLLDGAAIVQGALNSSLPLVEPVTVPAGRGGGQTLR